MINFEDALNKAQKIKEIIEACEFLYWSRWKEIREEHRKILEEHHIKNKTTNLLASAIQLSKWKSETVTLVLIWASI